MKKIWRFKLEIAGRQGISMPENSRVLCADNQNGTICLWVEIEEDYNEVIERTFHIVGTGHIFNGLKLNYISTVICNPFVWHVYEEMESGT